MTENDETVLGALYAIVNDIDKVLATIEDIHLQEILRVETASAAELIESLIAIRLAKCA